MRTFKSEDLVISNSEIFPRLARLLAPFPKMQLVSKILLPDMCRAEGQASAMNTNLPSEKYGAWNPSLESELPHDYWPLSSMFRAFRAEDILTSTQRRMN
jgi:hypothetical protein